MEVFFVYKRERQKWNTQTLVFLALLIAMHLVLTRLVAIDLGFCRITVGSVCTILAGLWFGPLAGGVCGLCSDLLGCFIKGYAVNPLITTAAILWGVVPALFSVWATGSRKRKAAVLCAGVAVCSVLSTLVFTTAGLVLMNGYPLLGILPARLLQWAVMMPVYCVLTCSLYFSPLTQLVRHAAGVQSHSAAGV